MWWSKKENLEAPSWQEMQEQADKKMEFFLAASHQLKSPVAIIQWCLQSILEEGHTEGKDQEMVRKALIQANAMGQLVTDMLHVFRLQDAERRGQSLTVTELNGIIDEVLLQYETVASRREMHLVRGPREADIKVMADPPYLKQALINLVDNALKYSKPGGTVTVSLVTEKETAVLAVTDQGIGISDLDQHRLFTEFFRTQEAQAMTHEGTGLGLVLVKHVMESFGGEIVVKSVLGKGSTFSLRLPLVK